MKSILFSLLQHFWKLPIGDAIAESVRAFIGILRALPRRKGEASIIAELRTRNCQSCPFYDAKWKTCGTPGDTMGEPLGVTIKIGCWCYLPLANRDPKKDCYARANDLHDEHGQMVGWPDALRPNH